MMKMLAVDPGDVYTGVAFFEEDAEERFGWRCIDAQEMGPDEFVDALAETVLAGDVDVLVYESFRLYPDKAMEQQGSEFLTSQCIGAIRFIIRNHNRHATQHELAEEKGGILTCEQPGGVCNDATNPPKRVTLVKQRADDKKPARGICRAKGVKAISKAISKAEYHGRDHIVDAELHGWYWILKSQRRS